MSFQAAFLSLKQTNANHAHTRELSWLVDSTSDSKIQTKQEMKRKIFAVEISFPPIIIIENRNSKLTHSPFFPRFLNILSTLFISFFSLLTVSGRKVFYVFHRQRSKSNWCDVMLEFIIILPNWRKSSVWREMKEDWYTGSQQQLIFSIFFS